MMRTSVCLSFLIVLASVSFSRAQAGDDPGDRFLAAYFLVQQGDAAVTAKDWSAAQAKYNAALTVLGQIKTESPEWHPNLIDFRTRYCTDHLAAMQSNAPVETAAQPLPQRVIPPAPPSEADQIQQLQAELQKSRDEVHLLTGTRDQLKSQLEVFLKDPAPTEREKAKETLAQLRALQAANDTANAQLATAQAKADRADALAGQLAQAQEKVKALESSRDQLNGKLQEALAKVDAGKTTAQVEELMKTNSDLTAQLATAQSEITKLHDTVLVAAAKTASIESAETIQLRSSLAQAHSELEQTRTSLTQRTEELRLTRAQVEQLSAENQALHTSKDELMAKLDESDRQLAAAKASGEKNDQIIQQLHKENEVLRQMADRKDNQTTAQAGKTEDSGGFLWFKPRKKPAVAPEPVATNVVATVQSEDGKLTASVKAPKISVADQAAAEASRAAAEAAEEVPQGSAEIRMLLGQAHEAVLAKDFSTAKGYLTTAADKDPANINVLNALANTLYQLNQLDEGADVLLKVIALEPNQAHARSTLGIIYLRKGRIEDAYNQLTRAVAIEPRNAEAHNYLGIVMSAKGWATAGEQEIRRAVELKPDYADAQFNLAVIYAREKEPRLDLARYHYQKAVDLGSARDASLENTLRLTEATDPTKPATKVETP